MKQVKSESNKIASNLKLFECQRKRDEMQKNGWKKNASEEEK